MASHAGLVYTIKTKRGYIGPDNTYVDNIEDAVSTSYYSFCGTSELLKRFGYDETEGEIVIIEESYDSRLGSIEQLLLKMGYEGKGLAYMQEAERIFNQYNCYEYTNYLRCIKYLNDKLSNNNFDDIMVSSCDRNSIFVKGNSGTEIIRKRG